MMALNAFEGAVILITHDTDLLASTMDRLWLVAHQKVAPYEGDLDDYRRLVLKGDHTSSQTQKNTKRPKETKAHLQKMAHDAKIKMEALLCALQEVKEELDNPDLYSHHSDALTELLKKQHQLEKELQHAEEEWLEAATMDNSVEGDTL